MRSSPAPSSARAALTIRCASVPNGRTYCVLAVRVLDSVSCSVHSWRLRIAFQGSSWICSPSSMPLARTTSSSAVSSGTREISRRYSRTESSVSASTSSGISGSSASGSVIGWIFLAGRAITSAAWSSAPSGALAISAASSASTDSRSPVVGSSIGSVAGSITWIKFTPYSRSLGRLHRAHAGRTRSYWKLVPPAPESPTGRTPDPAPDRTHVTACQLLTRLSIHILAITADSGKR